MIKLLFGSVICLLMASVALTDSQGVNWALLVAGSNGFYNYRHQADVCHAYQIIRKNGIPDERIVVMMYDDIANNEENSRKGVIINRPNGPDVYKGTLKDYTRENVTAENFLKVLQGIPTNAGSGKVINSGPDDNIFVFFSDHGAPGIVVFPDDKPLHAKDLNKAIKSMRDQNKFKNMVMYIEACESGSMFENLLANNINVYATTAANSKESSYACYWDQDLMTYLGDLYSVNWMEDTERENIDQETLLAQFTLVKKETNESHAQQFGDLKMGPSFFVSEFQAEKSAKLETADVIPVPKDTARAYDITVTILTKRLEATTDPVKKEAIQKQLNKEVSLKKMTTNVMKRIVSHALKNEKAKYTSIVHKRQDLQDHECYSTLVDRLTDKCFSLRNEYVLRNLYMLVNLCESGVSVDTVLSAIDQNCPKRIEF